MGEQDWSHLPQEIIESISKRIKIYSDYLRFRYVCRSWNSSVPKIPLHLPPQLPWLMLSRNSFFNLSTNKIHRLNLPWQGRICGCSHGWFIVILKQTSELTLLNLITGSTFSLPSLDTYAELVAKLFHHSNNNFHLIKVVLSSSPALSDDDDFVAFAILNNRDFVFCKKGYDSWVLLNVSENNHKWIDAVYKNGSFFVTSMTGTIAVCDVEVPRVYFVEVPEITPVHFHLNCFNKIYYTLFAGEEMLLVQMYYIGRLIESFLIFKMNWNVLKWEQIKTLGEQSVFVGKNSSLYFSAADFVGCRPNCIYFADDLDGEPVVGIYSVSDKRIYPLPCDSYITNCGLGYPFWVTPNP